MKRIRVKISVTHLLTCNGKLITRYAFMAAIILALVSCSKVKPYSIVDSPANTTKFDVGCDGNDTLAETSWRIYCWKYNVDPVNPSDEEENSYMDWYMGSNEEAEDLDSVLCAEEKHIKIESDNGVTNVYTEN
ncbi:MAG: hypothetical protein SPH22_09500 [Prevotella sp.]|nr:hypothetical protein [Prevotella sp.]MDY5289853.1 hypothetical protein [Prevotella sp.]